MSGLIDVVVSNVRAIARDVVEIDFISKSGQLLPGATPGSHIDVQLPNSMTRQYSLINALGETSQPTYKIGVGLDVNTRGGSQYIHERLKVGQQLRISEPRNHFEMNPKDTHVLLIGGGIGITPVYAMAQYCQHKGLRCELWACARDASRLAYLQELKAFEDVKVDFYFDDEKGEPIDLKMRLKEKNWQAVYGCGPAPMLDALTAATQHWPEGTVRMERFKAPVLELPKDQNFEIVLQGLGVTTSLEQGETVLDAIERVGGFAPFSCREGICGTCEVTVLEGEIDHRDYVLTPEERDAGNRMMVCVSGCKGSKLVLDI